MLNLRRSISFLLLSFAVLPLSSMANSDMVKFSHPLREYSVIVTPEGFYPKSFIAYEGEKVRFFVTSTLDTPGCFILDEHKIFLSAQKGKIAEGETVLKHAGEYKIYCPSFKHLGKLSVFNGDKNGDGQKVNVTREVASIPEVESSGPRYWLPRDYD